MTRHESFLVRVWRRPRPGEGQWVGRVEHLQQRETRTFHDPEELLVYLRAAIGPGDGVNQEPSPAEGADAETPPEPEQAG